MPRRDDDYDDVPAPLGPLDKMYRDTNIVVLVIFGFCCGLIAFVLTLVAFLTAKDPKAKSNATVVLIISGIMSLLNVVATIMQLAGQR
jgi:heme/copper-type cytochrome/quinol oxidase subunit 4